VLLPVEASPSIATITGFKSN